MQGNPNPRAASVHPFHRSGAIIDFHPERWKANEQPAGQAENPGIWRDQLLAEIEALAEMLKEKVARYSSLRVAMSSDQAGELADATAVVWIQDALEDIAATALGIEIASRELFRQAASAENAE